MGLSVISSRKRGLWQEFGLLGNLEEGLRNWSFRKQGIPVVVRRGSLYKGRLEQGGGRAGDIETFLYFMLVFLSLIGYT